MAAEQPSSQRERLPWAYWPIMAVALVGVMLVAGVVGALVGVNPYIAAFVGGALYTYRETWIVAKRGRR